MGVTEQMEEFVAVLETTLPHFFKGALKLYRQGIKMDQLANNLTTYLAFKIGSKSHLRKTNMKIPPRAETIALFKNSTVWQLENEFYEFALRQFEHIKSRTLNSDLSGKGQQFFYEKIRPK